MAPTRCLVPESRRATLTRAAEEGCDARRVACSERMNHANREVNKKPAFPTLPQPVINPGSVIPLRLPPVQERIDRIWRQQRRWQHFPYMSTIQLPRLRDAHLIEALDDSRTPRADGDDSVLPPSAT